ncbi:MAG: zinc ABC transporter substrate-binding protein [Acidimicrobiia bacterium]|nr:zinc ABC transporter substrate-binding protein [Acidimicrobiia bacterium]
MNGRTRTPWGAVLALSLGTALVAGACGGASDDTTLQVVATTSVLGDVVENVVGPDATVEVLVPLGSDPHDYQASAQQVAALQQADLVVANGLSLEEGLSDVLASVASDGANLLEIAPLVDPIPFGDGTTDDPHVWLDPVRMADAADLIAAELSTLSTDGTWQDRSDAYRAELLALDAEISASVSELSEEDRVLVTNHDALEYFAARYGFEVAGTVIPSGTTLAEPSSAELAALVEEIDRLGVRAIFAETTEPTTLAEAIAAEAGEQVQVVELYTGSLGEAGSGADTLIGMLRTNARLIVEALQ